MDIRWQLILKLRNIKRSIYSAGNEKRNIYLQKLYICNLVKKQTSKSSRLEQTEDSGPMILPSKLKNQLFATC